MHSSPDPDARSRALVLALLTIYRAAVAIADRYRTEHLCAVKFGFETKFKVTPKLVLQVEWTGFDVSMHAWVENEPWQGWCTKYRDAEYLYWDQIAKPLLLDRDAVLVLYVKFIWGVADPRIRDIVQEAEEKFRQQVENNEHLRKDVLEIELLSVSHATTVDW